MDLLVVIPAVWLIRFKKNLLRALTTESSRTNTPKL